MYRYFLFRWDMFLNFFVITSPFIFCRKAASFGKCFKWYLQQKQHLVDDIYYVKKMKFSNPFQIWAPSQMTMTYITDLLTFILTFSPLHTEAAMMFMRMMMMRVLFKAMIWGVENLIWTKLLQQRSVYEIWTRLSKEPTTGTV